MAKLYRYWYYALSLESRCILLYDIFGLILKIRNKKGEIKTFEPTQNLHKKGILRETVFPAQISKKCSLSAKNIAKKIAKELNIVGIIAVEMFVLKDESILVNEIAPRPHNSFHWTLNGCNSSQFDILVRTICGLPVKDVDCNGKWEMTNLIGQDVNNINLYKDQNYILHIYGKKNVKAGRKMGHYNRNIS